MANKPEATAPHGESIAVALENASRCALAMAEQVRNPNSTAILDEMCRSAGVNLGDLTDGEASVSFVVVAVAAVVEETQK